LPPRAGSVPRGHDDEAVARHAEEPQAAEAAPALSGRPGQGLLQARHRAAGRAIQPRRRVDRAAGDDDRVGDVYLSAVQIASRVAELGETLAGDYEGREPLLVGALKASLVFLADLSRALPIVHAIDFVELAGYGAGGETGGTVGVRLLNDL